MRTPLLPMQQAAAALPDAGLWSDVLRMIVALALVSAGAFFALRWVARRGGFGPVVPGSDPRVELRVLARVALEPRKALYLVRVGDRLVLLATGETGAPSLLLELERGVVSTEAAPASAAASTKEPGDG